MTGGDARPPFGMQTYVEMFHWLQECPDCPGPATLV